MSRIFVTGGSGFIGTNLVQYLVDNGNHVVNYDIKEPRNIEHSTFWVGGDILDFEKLVEEVGKFNPEYFVHLAARTDLNGRNVVEYPANTEGVLNVVKAIRKCGFLKRVLFVSSRLVCKIGYLPQSDSDYCPSTFYGESKVVGEKIVRENASIIPCTWAILRPTSIWGPWFDTPYKEFFLSIVNSNYIHPRGLHIYKSFGYVGNSVFMIDKLLQCSRSLVHNKTLYLTDYPPIEVQKWANLIATKSGHPLPLEIPLYFLKLVAYAGNLMKFFGWRNPPLTKFRLNNLITNMVYETSNLENICGHLPYTLDDGVELTLEWLKLKRR